MPAQNFFTTPQEDSGSYCVEYRRFFSTTMKKVVIDKPIEMPDNEYTFLMISWVRIKT